MALYQDNDDEQQEEIQKINSWMNDNPIGAVEVYFENELKIDISQIWYSTSEMGKKLYDKFIEKIYDKYSDDIFKYLAEHPEEMR